MTHNEQLSAIEAILFVAGSGVEMESIARALGITQLEMNSLAEELLARNDDTRGLEICRTDDLLQMRTKAQYSNCIRDALKPVARKTLSRSVLETLSIIAYKRSKVRQTILKETCKELNVDTPPKLK